MSHAVTLVATAAAVEAVRDGLGGVPGLEIDEIDAWNSPAYKLDAPFTPAETDLTLAAMTVLVDGDDALRRLAATLTGCPTAMLVLDASTGGELGRTTPGDGVHTVTAILRRATVLD